MTDPITIINAAHDWNQLLTVLLNWGMDAGTLDHLQGIYASCAHYGAVYMQEQGYLDDLPQSLPPRYHGLMDGNGNADFAQATVEWLDKGGIFEVVLADGRIAIFNAY